MKKIHWILFVLAFFALPLISADLIIPGYHNIPIVNNITNFASLSDYYFLTVCTQAIQEVSLISDGIIGDCYKFSKLSVYAVKKADFKISEIEIINNLNYTDFDASFNQSKFVEVISNIEHYRTVPISSSENAIYNEYVIDINKLKTQPDNKEVRRSKIIYSYIFFPILALIIISLILLSRKRKNASA